MALLDGQGGASLCAEHRATDGFDKVLWAARLVRLRKARSVCLFEIRSPGGGSWEGCSPLLVDLGVPKSEIAVVSASSIVDLAYKASRMLRAERIESLILVQSVLGEVPARSFLPDGLPVHSFLCDYQQLDRSSDRGSWCK